MESFTIKIRTLTPIWTGDVTGRSTGELKISGIIGGMRQAFEMLVRKHGGNTCDCTSKGNRCPKEEIKNGKKEKFICPACAIFGCTGLSRIFSIHIEGTLKPIMPELPISDGDDGTPNEPNRDHTKARYHEATVLGKWLAVCSGHQMGEANETNYYEYFQKAGVKVVSAEKLFLKFSLIRPVKFESGSINIEIIIRYLLAFMARYSGLGAKVQQGWGVFEMIEGEIENIEEKGIVELKKLISGKKLFPMTTNLPNAKNCFSVEWKIDYMVKGLDFCWKSVDKKIPPWQIGYGLRYRLRRRAKFADLTTAYQPRNGRTPPVFPWNKTLDFVHIMFGYDQKSSGAPRAGHISVSHVLEPHSENSRIRLCGCIPDISGSIPAFLDDDRKQTLMTRYSSSGLSSKPPLATIFLIDEMNSLIKQAYPSASISPSDFYSGGKL